MELFADIPYVLKALFAACRISLWFILLFGFIGPLFLDHTRSLRGIEKLVYSWVGLGGVIIFTVFVLTMLNLYDFISFTLTLLLIPLVRRIWKSGMSLVAYFRSLEIRSVLYQLRFIENYRWHRYRPPWKRTGQGDDDFNLTPTIIVVLIALAGGMLRIYPALLHAAPFSRNWYEQLNRVKNLHLQDYFSGYPEPAGMHSLVSVFSMLTQVSPEMILHLLGALSSFFLCILIYWSIRDITKNEVPVAPILGMAVYAVLPLLLMPLSLDLQIEGNDLDLALCFAIPTLAIFVRNLRARYKSPWFYVLSGFIATGMTNLFVAFFILLPMMILSLFGLPRRRYWQSFFRVFLYLLSISALILGPIVLYNAIKGIDQYRYFLEQLLAIHVYTYNPMMVMPIQTLSKIFVGIAAAVGLGYLAEYLSNRKREEGMRDEVVFLVIFVLVASLYLPGIGNRWYWIDTAQIDSFYSVMIALFIGITFASLLRWARRVFKIRQPSFRMLSMGLAFLLFGGGIYLQGGVQLSRQLPATVPDGFHQSYYSIINEYLPYSYATVGPEISRIVAKNRNYFMNYKFFLDNYGRIDSLYRQQLMAPGSANTSGEIPPASIFIFVEKAPYQDIQQGILYDSPAVMRDLRQWLSSYQTLEGRTVRTYYEDSQSVVYQIVNRPNESKVSDILWHIYPDESSQQSNER